MIGLRLNLSLWNSMSFIGKLVTKVYSIRSSFGNYQELRQINTCSFQDGLQLKRPNSCTKGKCSPRMHQLESRQRCVRLYRILGRVFLKYGVCTGYSYSRKM